MSVVVPFEKSSKVLDLDLDVDDDDTDEKPDKAAVAKAEVIAF